MRKKDEKTTGICLDDRWDVRYFIDGEPVPFSMAESVAEESSYMADYVIGKEGSIREIRFDRILIE